MVALSATTARGFRDAGEPAGSGDVMQIRATIRLLAICAALAGAAVAGAGNAAASGLHTLYGFCAKFSCGDGSLPFTGLVMDPSGNLYGATAQGGVRNSGTVFEVIHRTGAKKGHLRTLYNFCALLGCADGVSAGGLVMDAAGNLYGLTSDGGTAGFGTAYRLTPNAERTKWQLQVLYNFCSADTSCPDGIRPVGGLTYAGAETGAPYDGTSPLYGVTARGGKGFGGIAFALVPRQGDRWALRILHVFCQLANCTDEGLPAGDLTIDGAGNLYGATLNHAGSIFELSPSGQNKWDYSVLYRFCALLNCVDGSQPNGQLARDDSGNLFGTTVGGGGGSQFCGSGCGVLFELAPGGAESVVHRFCSQRHCRDGVAPRSGPILDGAGDLFGTTSLGGIHSNGIVYEVSGDTLQVLHRFCTKLGCADGADPLAPLILDGTGNLYGTTTGGGGHGGGNVFELVR